MYNLFVLLCSRSGLGYHSGWRQRMRAFVSNVSLLSAKFATIRCWGGWSLCVCVFVVVYLQIKSVQLQDCICVFVSLALYISSCSGTLLRAKFVRDLALCAILQTKNKQLNWFIILLLHPTNQTPLKLVWGEYNAHVMLVFFFRISCFVVRHFFDAIAYPPNWVSQWVSQ